MWLSSAEVGQEASAASASICHHVNHHEVGGGDDGAGPERSAEAAELLRRVRVPVVHVHVVITTGGVGFQVENAELEHHHMTLWHLKGE